MAHPGKDGPICAVLGAGGFLGTNLCRTLAASGARLRAFGRSRPYPEPLAGIPWQFGQFSDRAALALAIEGCEVVYHLISASTPASSNKDPVADLEANTRDTLHLLDLCHASGVRRVVFVSSGGTVYGIPRQTPIPEDSPTDPICGYGISKLAIEKYLRLYEHLHGLEYVVLRVGNPYGRYQGIGKNQGVIAAFLARMAAGEPLEIWGDGAVVRDYVHVDDVVDAVIRAAGYRGGERIFNIGSGIGRSLEDIAGDLETLAGGPLERRYKPGRPSDVPVNVLDIDRARRELGWQPQVDWLDSLADALAWWRERPAS